MNEQNTKKILFNKSMLFSLKAELLKKQEEVLEKKQLPSNKLENFKPQSSKSNKKDEIDSKKVNKKTFKDSLKQIDVEELEACRKSKSALEKKADLYDHLSSKEGNSQLAGRFLVDFSSKKQHEKATEPTPEAQEIEDTAIDDNDDSDWTEFTDCLGRTRRCLKSDLDLYIKRDKELLKTMTKDQVKDDESCKYERESTPSEKPFLVQKTNDYLQSLREKWEEREKELLAKDNDIHYQDLLFDEARIHGVGYYSFSTDDNERQKQMEELLRIRQETLRSQKEAEEIRKQRDELMAARVAAARARQRARAGLPPEEPKESTDDFTAKLMEFLNQQKNEADNKAKEEEIKAKEEEEKERQKLREAYVREWDIGKDGVNDKVKKFREMTQEEYVEQQRAKRIDEFAPTTSTQSLSKSDNTFDDKGKCVQTHVKATTKTWSDVRPKAKTPPPPDIGDLNAFPTKGLYFSSSKKSDMKYKNFVKAGEPTPIVNEISDDGSVEVNQRPEKRKNEADYVEIAPPPTYDYYGPVVKQSRPQKPFDSDVREAYAQGTKSLENKGSNRQLSKQYDFTFD